VLAKVFEVTDREVFAITNGAVSGHTVKHLVAAGATYLILRNAEKRRPMGEAGAG
jgi:hypothetical protein